jgi:hypothetical protein
MSVGYFQRLTRGVGRQGRGRQNHRGTCPSPETLPPLNGRRIPTGSTTRRGTALLQRMQALRDAAGVPPRHGQEEREACDAVRQAGPLARSTVLHGTRWPGSQGRSSRAPVWRPRTAGAGGAPLSSALASHLRPASGRGSAHAGRRRGWPSWVAPGGTRRVAGGRGTRGGVPHHLEPPRGVRVRHGGGLPRRAHGVLGAIGGGCLHGEAPYQSLRPTRACS